VDYEVAGDKSMITVFTIYLWKILKKFHPNLQRYGRVIERVALQAWCVIFALAFPALSALSGEISQEPLPSEPDTLIETEASPEITREPVIPKPANSAQTPPAKPSSEGNGESTPKNTDGETKDITPKKNRVSKAAQKEPLKTHEKNGKTLSPITAALRYQLGVQGTRISGYDSLSSQEQLDIPVGQPTIKRPQPPLQGYIDMEFWPGRILSSSVSFQLGAEDRANVVDKATLQVFYPSKPDNGFGFSVGRDRALVGGFENETAYAIGKPLSTYLEYRVPFRDQRDRRTVDGMRLMSKSPVGEWNLQVMRDVTDTTYENSRKSFAHNYLTDTKSKRAAYALEGRYNLNLPRNISLTPLIQGSVYDKAKSRYFGAGLRLKLNRFAQTIDGGQDRRALGPKGEESPGDPLEYQVTRFYSLESSYDFKNGLTPFFKVSQYLTTQGVNREMTVMDARGNRSLDLFDDQSLDLFSGFQWKLGPFQPFGWFHWQRQKVISQPRNPYETVTITVKSVEAGVSGIVD
jgi:hypothetical protein